MASEDHMLHVYYDDGVVTFPAYVSLPPSARPDLQALLAAHRTPSVKCITLSVDIRSPPSLSWKAPTYKQQIAFRWGIPVDRISALSVSSGDQFVLIEDHDDWHDWARATFAWIGRANNRHDPDAPRTVDPIHIKVLIDTPAQEHLSTPGPSQSVTQTSPSSTSSTSTSAAGAQHGDAATPPAASSQPTDEPTIMPPTTPTSSSPQNASLPSMPSAPSPQTDTTGTPAPQQQTFNTASTSAAALANDIAGSVLQALQPVSRDLPVVLSSLILSAIPQALSSIHSVSGGIYPGQGMQFAHASAVATSSSIETPASTSRSTSLQEPSQPVDTTLHEEDATTSASTPAQQRQSLIEGMLDELARVRAQPAPTAAPQATPPPSDLAQEPAAESAMSTELGHAFAEMLSQPDAGALAQPERQATDDDETFSIVSTPASGGTTELSRSRSRSRSRSPRLGSSGMMLTLLTLFTFLIGLVVPVSGTALNPHAPMLARDAPVVGRQTRQLHLCKCTCFQTNSTLVPLYAPADPSKPCATCTRQFCLDQSLDICKGAKLEHTDHDVGTGFEGDVWAKCFERDSYKDQSIITLYLLVLVALVAFAALRPRMEGWYQDYQRLGPQGIYDAVRQSPWRTSSR